MESEPTEKLASNCSFASFTIEENRRSRISRKSMPFLCWLNQRHGIFSNARLCDAAHRQVSSNKNWMMLEKFRGWNSLCKARSTTRRRHLGFQGSKKKQLFARVTPHQTQNEKENNINVNAISIPFIFFLPKCEWENTARVAKRNKKKEKHRNDGEWQTKKIK